jgi:hypothetical protein
MDSLFPPGKKLASYEIRPKIGSSESATTLGDFVDHTRPRPVRFLVYSIGLEIAAWSVLLLLSFTVYLLFASARSVEGVYDLSGLVLALTILFVALRRVGKRFRLVSKKLLLTETRKPILYLRSFYEEAEPDAVYYDRARTDETLAQVLRTIGPLVAVGKPSDRLQPLGAIRVYFNNEVWREKVEALMSMSKLVMIQAGCSPGLEWEIATSVKRLKPEQLIFTFLSWQELDGDARQSKYEEFAMRLKSISHLALPERIDGAYFLYFKQNWKANLASLSGWTGSFFYLASLPGFLLKSFTNSSQGTFNKFPAQVSDTIRKSSVASVREALRPVLKMQGVTLPIWETMIYISLVLAIGASFIYLALRIALKLGVW